MKKQNDTLKEVNEIYTESLNFMENSIKEQLKISKELNEILKEGAFKENIDEIISLKDEIKELKEKLAKLNEKNDITLSSLLKDSVKNQYIKIANAITDISDKTVNSLTHLYISMKNTLNDKITTAEKNIIETKIKIVKSLSDSMAGFLKTQTKKLENCIKKLETLSVDIEKEKKKTETTKEELKPTIKKAITKSIIKAKPATKTTKKKSVIKELDKGKKKVATQSKTKAKTAKKEQSMEM